MSKRSNQPRDHVRTAARWRGMAADLLRAADALDAKDSDREAVQAVVRAIASREVAALTPREVTHAH